MTANPLRTVSAANVEMRSIEWLDKPLLQGSAFHLITGPKGVGKGTWLARVTSRMTTGDFTCGIRNVLIVSSEDSAAIDLVPRLTAAGADLDRVRILDDRFALPDDLDRLRDAANEFGNVGLIVIDPLGNHLGGADTDREGAVRFAIAGLNNLADDLGCTVLGVRHLAKSRQNGALASVLGSTAWVDLPRCVLGFAPDDTDDDVFHVQVIAGNRSKHGDGHSYRIELRDVGLKEPVTCAIDLGASRKNVDDLLAAPRRNSKSDGARDLILDALEQAAGQEMDSDTLDARIAAETGLSAKTVKNLRGELKNAGLIKSVPLKNEYGEVQRWMVARTAAPRQATA